MSDYAFAAFNRDAVMRAKLARCEQIAMHQAYKSVSGYLCQPTPEDAAILAMRQPGKHHVRWQDDRNA